MRLAVPARLRGTIGKIAGTVADAILGALGELLPTTADAFQELEQRLTSVAQATIVAPTVHAVLVALHRSEHFVLACLDQARAARGITPHSKQEVKVRLLCGATIAVRSTYSTVVREKRPGRRRGVGRHGPEGRGSYPVLAQLGIVEHASPALHSDVARTSAAVGSFAEAQDMLAQRGVPLHVNAVRLLAQRFADAGIVDRDEEIIPAPGTGPLAGKRVVIAIDGGRLRVRQEKQGRPGPSGHRGYEAIWREPKLLAVYTVNERGKKDGEFIFYEATLQSYNEAIVLFTRWLRRFGIADAREVMFAADGSEHVWDRVPLIQTALGLDPSRIRYLVDFWHAVEHAFAASKLVPRLTPYEASLRARLWKKWLREGRALDVSNDIEAAAAIARGEARDLLTNHAAYFRTNAERMRYPDLRAAHLPTGTGVVESAIRRVVNLRLKGNGIFWEEENAERMLLLRSRLKAGRWKELESAVHRHASGLQAGALAQARLRAARLREEAA